MIVDASVVTAALTNQASVGRWARAVVAVGGLQAPHVMPAEVCQALRRLVVRGDISVQKAEVAFGDLGALDSALHGFEPFAMRVWELRDTVSAYDAWYVALAEALDVPLATLDARLARVAGTRCTFLVPGDSGS